MVFKETYQNHILINNFVFLFYFIFHTQNEKKRGRPYTHTHAHARTHPLHHYINKLSKIEIKFNEWEEDRLDRTGLDW